MNKVFCIWYKLDEDKVYLYFVEAKSMRSALKNFQSDDMTILRIDDANFDFNKIDGVFVNKQSLENCRDAYINNMED